VESLQKDKKAFEEHLRSHAEETRNLQENMEKQKNELKWLIGTEILSIFCCAHEQIKLVKENVLNLYGA
jgi:hypothetical protein